jgi:predicted transposase/invertase (TIGR01784 family)
MKYDYENVMAYAVEQAAEKAEAKGKAEGKIETAKNLLAMGLPIEQIVRATGLSLKEVQHL